MSTGRSETLTGTADIAFPEFHVPPADPVPLLRAWFEGAARLEVREPRALALATADTRGRPSTRTVAINRIADEGFVFATHAGSGKGREMTANPWASGVLYWRETSQQIIVSGAVERLSEAVADELWFSRPAFTHPMSVASRQSEDLDDIGTLRAEVGRLAAAGGPLPRPEGYAGFLLRFDSVEFWANGADRLHERLRYDRTDDGWTPRRLQP
ncbi:phenazine biosynthesis FMN-dependent oxidase PhzG [Streptomyces sp. NPDC055025]